MTKEAEINNIAEAIESTSNLLIGTGANTVRFSDRQHTVVIEALRAAARSSSSEPVTDAASPQAASTGVVADKVYAYHYERATATTSGGRPALWQNELSFGKPDTYEYIRKVVPLYTHPPASSLAGRDEIAEAFMAGAEAVHLRWKAAASEGNGDFPPNGDPEFGEAATDYAEALLARLVTPGDDQTPVVQIASGDLLCEACGAWTPAALVPKHPSAEPIDAQQPEAEARVKDGLLPCPFCGSADVACIDQGDNDFATVCKSCGANAAFSDCKAQAIRDWNTRPSAPQAEPVYEEEWRDIASAPKDGTQIDIVIFNKADGRQRRVPDAYYDHEMSDWCAGSNCEPAADNPKWIITHWARKQAIPSPPKGGADGK